MKVRALFPLAAAAGFWLADSASAQQPAALPVAVSNPNQTLADGVAGRIRSANVADGADVRIVAQEGTVTLTGSARDAAQKDRIIAEVQDVEENKTKRREGLTFDAVGEGALVVELIDNQADKTVWIGGAKGDLRHSRTSDETKQRLAYAVDEMFKTLSR